MPSDHPSASLVLSLFPGVGFLDRAFEEEGFCVVRGPDVLWGGDVHRFHPPAGVFAGVIGGPPCQAFSQCNQAGCEPTFTANAVQWDRDGGRSRSSRTRASLRRGLRLQGYPEDYFDNSPFTVGGAIRVVGNGVPLPLGRAIAHAVREAIGAPAPQEAARAI